MAEIKILKSWHLGYFTYVLTGFSITISTVYKVVLINKVCFFITAVGIVKESIKR